MHRGIAFGGGGARSIRRRYETGRAQQIKASHCVARANVIRQSRCSLPATTRRTAVREPQAVPPCASSVGSGDPLACDAQFFGREAKVVLKYFMLRKGLKRQKTRKQHWIFGANFNGGHYTIEVASEEEPRHTRRREFFMKGLATRSCYFLVVCPTPRGTAKAGMLPVLKYDASWARLVGVGFCKPLWVSPPFNVQACASRRRGYRRRGPRRGWILSGLGECARRQYRDRYGYN